MAQSKQNPAKQLPEKAVKSFSVLQHAFHEILIFLSSRPDLPPELKSIITQLAAEISNPFPDLNQEKIERQLREFLYKLEVLDQQNVPGREQVLRRLAKTFLDFFNDPEINAENPFQDELAAIGEKIINATEMDELNQIRETAFHTVIKSKLWQQEEHQKWDNQIRELAGQVLQILKDPENEHPDLNAQIDTIVALINESCDYYTLTHINRRLKNLLQDYQAIISRNRKERQELLQIISGLVEALQSFHFGSDTFARGINSFLDELKSTKDLNNIHKLRESLIRETRRMLESTQKSNLDSRKLHQRLLATQSRILILENELQAIREKLAEALKDRDRDHLTSLPNRRSFDKQVQLAMESFFRHKVPHCLAILDIDHFKKINDRYGHQIGDVILKEVAHRIRSRLRKIDFLARYGGEEFGAIFSNTTNRGAFIVMERIRKAIAGSVFKIDSFEIEVTISIGISEMELSFELEDWIAHADTALYAAKQGGRNQVRIAGLEINQPESKPQHS